MDQVCEQLCVRSGKGLVDGANILAVSVQPSQPGYVPVEADMAGHKKTSQNQKSNDGHEADLKLKTHVVFIPIWIKTSAYSHIRELHRKVRMKQHEKTI